MFDYNYTKQGLLQITYCNKVIMCLKDQQAEKLYQKLGFCKDDKKIQLLLAKATGNFKRGNEKLAKNKA